MSLLKAILLITIGYIEIILSVSERIVKDTVVDTAGLKPDAGHVAVIVFGPINIIYSVKDAIPADVVIEEEG